MGWWPRPVSASDRRVGIRRQLAMHAAATFVCCKREGHSSTETWRPANTLAWHGAVCLLACLPAFYLPSQTALACTLRPCRNLASQHPRSLDSESRCRMQGPPAPPSLCGPSAGAGCPPRWQTTRREAWVASTSGRSRNCLLSKSLACVPGSQASCVRVGVGGWVGGWGAGRQGGIRRSGCQSALLCQLFRPRLFSIDCLPHLAEAFQGGEILLCWLRLGCRGAREQQLAQLGKHGRCKDQALRQLCCCTL